MAMNSINSHQHWPGRLWPLVIERPGAASRKHEVAAKDVAECRENGLLENVDRDVRARSGAELACETRDLAVCEAARHDARESCVHLGPCSEGTPACAQSWCSTVASL